MQGSLALVHWLSELLWRSFFFFLNWDLCCLLDGLICSVACDKHLSQQPLHLNYKLE
jgi:hypothetical protein